MIPACKSPVSIHLHQLPTLEAGVRGVPSCSDTGSLLLRFRWRSREGPRDRANQAMPTGEDLAGMQCRP